MYLECMNMHAYWKDKIIFTFGDWQLLATTTKKVEISKEVFAKKEHLERMCFLNNVGTDTQVFFSNGAIDTNP